MPRAEIPEGAVEATARCQFEVVCPKEDWSRQSAGVRGEWRKDAERDLRAALPALHAYWLEQLKEELVEDAYCVEEFLRKVTQWEGCAEDELAEAIESAEKLSGRLDSTPISIEEGGDGG